MRLYEVVYIFDAAMDEAAVSQKLEEYHALVTTDNGGEITAVDHWGARQLAYPIKKQKSGYFVVAQFKTEPVSLPEFERLLKLDDQVLRYLVVLNEGEPTTGMSSLAPRPPATVEREDDEDDDNNGEGEDEEAEAEADPRTSPPEFAGGRGRRRRVEGPPIQLLNYKDVSTLSRFLTEQGKILPKRTTKVTARFQRQLGTAVKRARYLSLLPYIRDHEA